MRKASMCFTLVLLCGCQTYFYKFTDNQTHKVFYKELNSPPDRLPSSIALADPETGAVTVTTAYTATPVTAEEYDANRPRYQH